MRSACRSKPRLTRLRMTGSGQEAGTRAGEVLVELNARLSEGFTPEELQTVARWLALATALEPGASQD